MAACQRRRTRSPWTTRSGVFGHNITMLDFSDQELEYFRRIGRMVEFEDVPGVVETALALSGSAAQSKIQSYPGDCDYFERVNILAPTREEACRILAGSCARKRSSTLQGPTYQLIEVKFGSYPEDMVIGDRHGARPARRSPGSPTRSRPARSRASARTARRSACAGMRSAPNPGWCKLDWVVADPIRKQLANASNMLDVTWEAPDGEHHPAGRLPGSLLPGGLPGGQLGADLLQAGPARLGQRAGRLRRPAGA